MRMKILLWLIGGGVLLIVLTLAGFYLYFAIPMQKNFAKLETVTSSDCATGDRWQIMTPLQHYPPQLRVIFEFRNNFWLEQRLSRTLLDSFQRSMFEPTEEDRVSQIEFRRHYNHIKRIELAMNHWPMGEHGHCIIYGITAAAQHYFNKKPEQLTLLEMVFLANFPDPYHPYKDSAVDIVKDELSRLRKLQVITETEWQSALRENFLHLRYPHEIQN